MIGVYKIQNQINGKCYIGQSRNIHKRWNTHRNAYKNPKDNRYDTPLYRAMRKYGIQHFDFTILEECDIESLNRLERQYITQYDSFWNGYNCSFGGENGGTNQVQKNVIRGIIHDLETTDMLHREIAEKWNISTEMVQGINTGRYWAHNRTYPIQTQHKVASRHYPQIASAQHTLTCIDCGAPITSKAKRCATCAQIHLRKVTRPTAEELLEMLPHCSFEELGRKYSVSGRTIKNWCIQYGIPSRRCEYNATVMPPKQKPTRHKSPIRPVHMVDIITNTTIQTFPSILAAEKYLRGKETGAIRHALKSTNPTAYGYKWAYADENT